MLADAAASMYKRISSDSIAQSYFDPPSAGRVSTPAGGASEFSKLSSGFHVSRELGALCPHLVACAIYQPGEAVRSRLCSSRLASQTSASIVAGQPAIRIPTVTIPL